MNKNVFSGVGFMK